MNMEAAPILRCTVDGCTEPRLEQNPNATCRQCLGHRARANRKWNSDRLEQEHGKGYCRGVEDMRLLLANLFVDRIGEGNVTGNNAAEYILGATGPVSRAPLSENGTGTAKKEASK